MLSKMFSVTVSVEKLFLSAFKCLGDKFCFEKLVFSWVCIALSINFCMKERLLIGW